MPSAHKTGLAVGALLAGWHALWCLLLAAGVAQRVLDWVLWLHFLNDPYVVEPFSVARAFCLVAFTGISGYGIGWILSTIWPRPSP